MISAARRAAVRSASPQQQRSAGHPHYRHQQRQRRHPPGFIAPQQRAPDTIADEGGDKRQVKSERTVSISIWRRLASMSCGPSISHEANINGSTGINALHTTSDMIGGRVAWDMIFLLKILPQADAAARVSIKPTSGTCSPPRLPPPAPARRRSPARSPPAACPVSVRQRRRRQE